MTGMPIIRSTPIPIALRQTLPSEARPVRLRTTKVRPEIWEFRIEEAT